jgi:hypothetical protein
LINLFGISSLVEFISNSIHLPSNIQESIIFLSIKGCEHFEKIFKHSILIPHFEEIRIDQFPFLTNFILETLFPNEELQYENEDFLFKIVIKLIHKDFQRKTLLKLINFHFVSSSLFKEFFKDFPLDGIDLDLFSSLKNRLFFDISKSELRHAKRWRTIPNILSQTEIDEFFGIMNSYLGENIHPVLKTKYLLLENQQMKKVIEEKKEIISSLRKENSNIESLLKEIKDENQKFKTEFQTKIEQINEQIIQSQNSQIKEKGGATIEITDNYGIIHFLKQNPSNQMVLSCSESQNLPINNI